MIAGCRQRYWKRRSDSIQAPQSPAVHQTRLSVDQASTIALTMLPHSTLYPLHVGIAGVREPVTTCFTPFVDSESCRACVFLINSVQSPAPYFVQASCSSALYCFRGNLLKIRRQYRSQRSPFSVCRRLSTPFCKYATNAHYCFCRRHSSRGVFGGVPNPRCLVDRSSPSARRASRRGERSRLPL